MFDYKLALATGIDLPFPELETAIHQPTIKEIAMIGEDDFFIGVQLLCINKALIDDLILQQNITNFDVLMTLLQNHELSDKKIQISQVLSLLFPGFKISFTPRSILLNRQERNIIIDEGTFDSLQRILQEMFCLKKTDQNVFNPADQRAKEIADKLMRARQRVAQEKSNNGNSGSMLGQYLSILAIGTHTMTLQECCNLTLYQLQDLIERYSLYINWDLDVRSRMAGGTSDRPLDDWMKNIH